MKRWTVVIIAVLLSACTLPSDVPETISEISVWVHENITYTSEPLLGNAQLPNRTLELGQGDCEDHAILLMYLFYQATGNKASLVAIVRKSGAHAIVQWDGMWYDPTSGDERVANVDHPAYLGVVVWDYDLTMMLAVVG